jgi:hypothetical protein
MEPGILSRFLLLPMDALGGTLVHGLLDSVFRSPVGIDHLGVAQGFIEAEYLGTNLLAIAAGNALIHIDCRDAFAHFSLLPVKALIRPD